ncbi:MAG TPA: hypothetical protein VFJ92_17495 [Gemmatimonadales bacterium]|nr:hypothetical protein [Gemmatimonadales bacterium]
MVETSEDQARRWLVRPVSPVVVVCAYCERMRDGDGEWQVTASRDRHRLSRGTEILVSHGCCPECLDRELARCHRADQPG